MSNTTRNDDMTVAIAYIVTGVFVLLVLAGLAVFVVCRLYLDEKPLPPREYDDDSEEDEEAELVEKV